MAPLIRFARLVRLRLLQIALHDAEATGNIAYARRIAPAEARLRAEVYPLTRPEPIGEGVQALMDDYELVEHQDWLGVPGAGRP